MLEKGKMFLNNNIFSNIQYLIVVIKYYVLNNVIALILTHSHIKNVYVLIFFTEVITFILYQTFELFK